MQQSLLLALTISFVLPNYWIDRAERQREGVKLAIQCTAQVFYDYQIVDGKVIIWRPKRPYPEWLTSPLGDDYFYSVAIVAFPPDVEITHDLIEELHAALPYCKIYWRGKVR